MGLVALVVTSVQSQDVKFKLQTTIISPNITSPIVRTAGISTLGFVALVVYVQS